ncbi:MAG: hypothetical protein IPI81_06305 [Flavobacteriales bacterium]|nr:hypothetical protein [Flavobacteriales bacterium]MCC6937238.1 hypothetical protein [Flavobacteriales bacterium]
MIRTISAFVLATSTLVATAQTQFNITNVTVTEKGVVKTGSDVSAEVVGSEGEDRLVMFDQDGLRVKAQARIHTHNSARSSIKDGAVYVTFVIHMKVDGDKDKREVQKTFYGEQERRTHFKEKFTIKKGINVRVITVEFDGVLN